MKKIITTAMVALCAVAASAADLTPRLINRPANGFVGEKVESFVKSASFSRASELSIEYTPAEESYAAYGLERAYQGQKYGQAFELTEDFFAAFTGNKISAINFTTGINTQTRKNQIRKYTVFLAADSVSAEPFYTQEYTTDVTASYTFVSVPLDEPWTIEQGKRIFCGITYNLTSSEDYTLVVDYVDHGEDNCAGWVGVQNGSEFTWSNFADEIGFLCLGVTVSGENLPMDRMQVVAISAPSVATVNQNFGFKVLVRNTGATPIKNVEVEYSVGNQQPVVESFNFTTPLAYNEAYIFSVPDCSYGESSANEVPIKFAVTSVNGVKNSDPAYSGSIGILVVPEGKGFFRNVVIEEVTGTWCGYCPVGITTMEAVRKNHPDGDIIPVVVHSNDPMQSASYADVASLTSSVPAAFINRVDEIYPSSYASVLAACREIQQTPALARIEVSFAASEDEANTIDITAKTEFTFSMDDADKRYAIAFGVTQDGMGPYDQSNYYAGSTSDCQGWEKQPNPVSVVYNDVARQLTSYLGNKNSVPASVDASEIYTYKYSMKLSSSITDYTKIHVVAYLMNPQTGVIENAAVAYDIKDSAAISEIAADSDAPAAWYTIQGVRVAEPSTHGVYIRVANGRSSKVLR